MIVLALDTCFSRCAACLYDSGTGRVLAAEALEMERGHAEALAPLVERLFKASRLGAETVERVAVTTGPGTFTGLRIGLGFARAFGLARGIPVIGLDSLAAVALALKPDEGDWLIAHKAGQSGFHYVLRKGAAASLLRHAEVVSLLKPASGLVLGTAAAELLAEAANPRLHGDAARNLPQPSLLAAHAAAAPATAGKPSPLYLREPDAKPQPAVMSTVRPAGAAELEAMANLHKSAFSKAWPAAELAAMLNIPGTEALLAEAEGQPAGFIITRAIAGEAEILTLAVAPAQRRHGWGRALLQAAISRLAAQGQQRLFLEVGEANAAARALYTASGFSEQGRRKGYYEAEGHHQDAIVMARALP